MKKRILSLMLALLMIATLIVPTSVQAKNNSLKENVLFQRYNVGSDIITVVTNNNDIAISIEDTISFLSNKNIIGTETKRIEFIAPGTSYCYKVRIQNIYKNKIVTNVSYTNECNISESKYIDNSKLVNVSSSISSQFLNLNIDNKGTSIDYLDISILYYKNDILFECSNLYSNGLGYSDDLEMILLMPTSSSTSRTYPDRYEIFVQSYR